MDKDTLVDKDGLLKLLGLDIDLFKEVLDNAKNIEEDDKFFAALSAIGAAKAIVKDALEVVESYEKEAKGLINAKAKATIDPHWQVIKGDHFKIQRSFTGKVYEVDDEKVDDIDPALIEVSFAPNTDAINEYRETNDNKLPDGISLNPKRGESIRITVK